MSNWNISVTGHKTKTDFSACPTANHCQGQLHIPQAVTVLAKQFAGVTEEKIQKQEETRCECKSRIIRPPAKNLLFPTLKQVK
jgi:DNA-directed RNA polymerase subunit RPC12/RpoP